MNDTINEIQKDIGNYTKETISRAIDDKVWEEDITYMEATQKVAELHGIQLEAIKKYLTVGIIEHIEDEAKKENLIRKK